MSAMCCIPRLPRLASVLAVFLLSVSPGARADEAPAPAPVAPGPSARPCPAPLLPVSGPEAPDALRILFWQGPDPAASCAVSHQEQRLLEEFAALQGYRLQWFASPGRPALHAALASGRVDIALGIPPQFDEEGMNPSRCADAPLPGAGEQEKSTPAAICHTLPWSETGEQLFGRGNGIGAPDSLDALRGRQVALRRHSPAWPLLQAAAKKSPGMSLLAAPEALSDEQIISRIVSGRYDLAVLDSLSLQHYLPAHPGLYAGLRVTEPRARSWAVRANAWSLHRALDEFIQIRHVRNKADEVALDDFDTIRKRRTLRLITIASPEHYYLREGWQQGFEYELLQGFAERHRLQLEVVLADSAEHTYALLAEGKGDVLAASLPAARIKARPGLGATVHYLHATPVVVGRRSDPRRLIDPSDLPGRRLTLVAGSPWLALLQELQEQGFPLDVHQAEATQDARAILAMVDRGMYDLAVVSARQLAGFATRAMDLELKFSLSEPAPLAWATRKDNHRLLAELNRYLDELYRGTTYNVLYRKHFPSVARADDRPHTPLLSRWDHIVAHYAGRHGFDQELIMAMMFQESRFDPTALSRAGAFGLMQLLPSTQDFLRVRDPAQPEQSIQAGVRYLDYLRARFEDELMPEERTWFSLAAYNAGLGRVREARHKARLMGLDDKVWFGNVEQAMLTLAEPVRRDDGELVRRCRCGETVVYVREIKTRYFNYLRYLRAQGTIARFVH